MTIEYFNVIIVFGKEIKNDNQVNFQCPYNNLTNFNDLLEIISILFPEKKICPCFKYEIKDKKYFSSIKKNDYIKEYIKTNEIILKIYKENDKCIYESNYQKYNQKSKAEVINDLLNSYKQRENDINKIENLEKENKNYKNVLEKIKKQINECKKDNDSLKKENENYKNELEKVNNELSECKKDNSSLKKKLKKIKK